MSHMETETSTEWLDNTNEGDGLKGKHTGVLPKQETVTIRPKAVQPQEDLL